jgi:hypothetical protein
MDLGRAVLLPEHLDDYSIERRDCRHTPSLAEMPPLAHLLFIHRNDIHQNWALLLHQHVDGLS